MVRHKAQNVAARPRTGDVQISEDIDFKSMLLPQPILEGLKKSGYIKPSPIQRKALPLVRCGLDLIVQAKAGTGKTCVFTVAILELVKPSLPHLQAVVLAPTREIALQITSVVNAIGQCVKGLKTGCFIGGYPLSVDVENVKGCQVAVAAPGRLKHLLEKGLLNPRHVRLFVLDEADKLMEKVFINDINAIFSQLPESKQVLACSATYTDKLVEFLARYMNGGQYVSPNQTISSTLLLGLRQFVSVIPRHVDRLAQLKLKEKRLLYLLQSVAFNQCLVFSNLHTRAVSLCGLLRGQGWGVEWIAGRQDQKDRVAALTQLRDQKVRVLVTTDLTARGVDLENVNLVINLDVPMDHHTYLHRMGRAGRYGSHGIVITVVSDGQELTAFQKLLGKIGGTTQSVNCVPQSLKNINLWTMPDDKFEIMFGVVEKVEASSTVDKSESNTTNTAKKYWPESSDSGGYVKEFKGENTAEKNSPESSDSEDYLKEYNGENDRRIDGIFNSAGKVSVSPEERHWVADAGNSDILRYMIPEHTSVTSNKTDDCTSTDERFSPESSDSEESADKCNEEKLVSPEHSCMCNLYVADACDVKVIAGPSLFALKKKDNWREVLPVIVNETKIPLNTPIALFDSMLIRVKFWDKIKRCGKDINVDISSKEVIHFSTKLENKDYLTFQDVVHFLENGVRALDPLENVCENNARQILSFENIEEALESGFCEIDGRILVKTDEIEQVLMKYNRIKERSERALIGFDSFDLVGWLAVDEFRNIVEEIDIDKCKVFEFNLISCPAGKNHIKVLSQSEGRSKEAHDYIDHITTLNVAKFASSTPFTLSNIAEEIAKATNSPDELFSNKIDPKFLTHKDVVAKQLPKERSVYDSESKERNGKCSDVKINSLLKNSSKVPIVSSNNKKCIAGKDENGSVNGQRNCNPPSTMSVVNSPSNKNNSTNCSYIGSNSKSNANRKNVGKILSDSNNSSHKEQRTKYDKKTIFNTENVTIESLQSSTNEQQHQGSSDKSCDSGPYVEMTWNSKNGQSRESLRLISTGKNIERNSQLPYGSHTFQESSTDKLNTSQCKSKSSVKNKKYYNGLEHTRKHRNSDDSYDSFDTVEYETTDLDKELCSKFLNENGIQRKHDHTKQQDLTNDSLKESYDSHEYHNFKPRKPKTLHCKHEKSKPHESRNKHPRNESEDTYSSIEAEGAKPRSKLLHRVPLNKEQKSKSKYRHELKHRPLHNDTQECNRDSYDSYNSVDSEISKLRELNSKLEEDKARTRHQSEVHSESGGDDNFLNFEGRTRHYNEVHSESGGDDNSFDSEGTNRHSFRTAHSQHLCDDCLCSYRHGTSNRNSRLSNHDWDNPSHQGHNNQPITFKHIEGEEQFEHRSYRRREGRKETFSQGQPFSDNVYSNYPHESLFHNQELSDVPGRSSSKIIGGKNLHDEWYSNWYLQVRQKAMQLAQIEYINTMSTP